MHSHTTWPPPGPRALRPASDPRTPRTPHDTPRIPGPRTPHDRASAAPRRSGSATAARTLGPRAPRPTGCGLRIPRIPAARPVTALPAARPVTAAPAPGRWGR